MSKQVIERHQWRMQDLRMEGVISVGLGDRISPPARSGAEPQPLAHFDYFEANLEHSGALQSSMDMKITAIIIYEKHVVTATSNIHYTFRLSVL